MLKTILTSLCLICIYWANAQSYSLSGLLVDENGTGVPYASLALSEPSDSSLVQFTVAKEDGTFRINAIEKGNYLVVVACVGFDVEYKPITIEKNVSDWKVAMQSSALSMKEVMVQANKIPILMNGDTVVYNSSSFKTQANASVEDLMKKLPGVKVNKDGQLTSEGEAITKILINGKEFFGGNVEAATKNLDADLVDKIEVIDKKTDEDEFTGEETKETEKVINLVLKEEHTHGYFGKIRAGYGTDNVRDVHGNVNFFKDATQLSIIGGLNNINERLYDWRDMRTLNSFAINPMNSWNSMTSWNSGLSTNTGVGANLHIEPIKGLKADVSYIVTDVSTVDTGTNNSEIYLTNNTIIGESLSTSTSNNRNHKISSKFEIAPDTLNKIIARFQYETLINSSNFLSRVANYTTISESILNSGVNLNNSTKDNNKLASKIHWTSKSKKNDKNHFLGSIYYGTSSVSTGRGSYFNSMESALLPFPGNETPIITADLASDEETVAATAAYQLEINKKFSIRPGVNWMGSDYEHTFDWQSDEGTLKSNSPVGSVRYDNLEYYAHFIFKLDSFTTLRVVPEFNQMIEERSFTTDSLYQYKYNQMYFIPFVFIQSRKKHKYNFYAHLRASVERPQTSQFLPVEDNTNPYSKVIGNIELQNFVRYSAYGNYRKMLGLGRNFSYNTWSNYTSNPVVSKVTVDEFNFATRELQNYKYAVSSSHSVSFNSPIKAIKGTIGLSANYSFRQNFSTQNEEELESINHNYGSGIELAWNEFDMWSLELGYDVGYNVGKIAGNTNNGFVEQYVYTEIIVNPLERLELSAELDLEMLGANAVTQAQTIPIFSAEISWALDTNQRWSIGAKAFDIFDQNQNIWRNWSGNRYVQSQNLALSRYIMATIRYRIKKPAKRKGKSGNPHG